MINWAMSSSMRTARLPKVFQRKTKGRQNIVETALFAKDADGNNYDKTNDDEDISVEVAFVIDDVDSLIN